MTPHCGDHSLSGDLTSDETSATGGRQRFARRGGAFALVPHAAVLSSDFAKARQSLSAGVLQARAYGQSRTRSLEEVG